MGAKRSTGVIILVIVLFLFTLPAFIMAGAAVLSGPPDKTIIEKATRILCLLSPICFLISAIGILMMKSWARIFTIIVSVVMLLSLGYGVIHAFDKESGVILTILPAIIFIGIICYLAQSNVKKQFN